MWRYMCLCILYISNVLEKKTTQSVRARKAILLKAGMVWMSLCRGSIAKHRRANVAAASTETRLSSEFPKLTKSDRAERDFVCEAKYFSPIDKIPDNPPCPSCPHKVAKQDILYKSHKVFDLPKEITKYCMYIKS